MLRGFFHSLFSSTRDLENNLYQRLSWLLVVASVPAAILGKLLESYAETVFRNPLLVAINLATFGLVILLSEKFGKKEKNLTQLNWKHALLIGLFQALAIVPGVSRSGASIAAALFLSFKRPDAARFSFLMSIPVIFGAGILEFKDFSSSFFTPELVLGFVSAGVFGFLAIKYLLVYIASKDFRVFVWYRFFLAAAIFVFFWIK